MRGENINMTICFNFFVFGETGRVAIETMSRSVAYCITLPMLAGFTVTGSWSEYIYKFVWFAVNYYFHGSIF
jgi:hypothetical protein